MKNLKVSQLLVFALFLFSLAACKKDGTAPPSKPDVYSLLDTIHEGYNDSGYTTFLYVDEESVDYIADIESYERIAITSTEDPSGGNRKLYVYAFTTEQGYIDFGTSIGQPFDKIVQFENECQAEAQRLGILPLDGDADVDIEALGSAYDDYKAFEESLYTSLFDAGEKPGRGRAKVSVTTSAGMWKDWNSGGYLYKQFSFPALWPGWNNKLSSWQLYTLYGCFIQYDHSWYRNHQTTFWNWGWSNVYYYWAWWSWLNDRYSSGFCF